MICRKSILHAIKLAHRTETQPETEKGERQKKIGDESKEVMKAFGITENMRTLKTFLGVTKPTRGLR